MAATTGKAIDAAYLLTQLKAFESQIIAVKYNIKFQFSSMPAPSADYLDQYVQYVGVTTADYTEGYFYKCVLKDGNYLWESVYQDAPEYTIKKDKTPSSTDYVATYHICKDDVAIGDSIDIPKDFFLSDAMFGIATAADVAPGGKLDGKKFDEGDTYLELDVNVNDGTSATVKKIFCKMNGLIDAYKGGKGIKIDKSTTIIDVDLADVPGLQFTGTDLDKLAVKSTNGIQVTADGIDVKVDPVGPITSTSTGVNISLANGIIVDTDKKVALNLADGIVVDTSKKVAINNDTSLKVDTSTKKIGIDFETANIDFSTDWNN